MGLVTMRIACLPPMWSLLLRKRKACGRQCCGRASEAERENCGYAGGGERGKSRCARNRRVDTVATGLVVTDSVPSAVAGSNAAVAASDYWTPVIDELAAFGEDAPMQPARRGGRYFCWDSSAVWLLCLLLVSGRSSR